jgi:hypothetical protein
MGGSGEGVPATFFFGDMAKAETLTVGANASSLPT